MIGLLQAVGSRWLQHAFGTAFAVASALLVLAGPAHAQTDPHLAPVGRKFDSPERFIFEARGGPYTPGVAGHDYGSFFKGDSGPNLGVHIDGIVYRMPRWFYLTAGGSLGMSNFEGNAVARDSTEAVSEKTTLTIVPVIATLGVRLDVLPRQLHIPLTIGARIGWEWAHWDTNTGARDDADGWSLGPFVSAQAALDLDLFEPGGARNLDEEWGINHTYLFGEVFHFAPTAKSLPLGATSWVLGLGLVF